MRTRRIIALIALAPPDPLPRTTTMASIWLLVGSTAAFVLGSWLVLHQLKKGDEAIMILAPLLIGAPIWTMAMSGLGVYVTYFR